MLSRESQLNPKRWAQWSKKADLAFLNTIWPPALLLLVALGAPLLFLLHVKNWEFPFDDSYITLTYAHNLATYNVFAFDPDLPAAGLGATSPLHVFLLALVIFILQSLPFASEVGISLAVGIAAHVGLVWSIYWLGLTMFNDRWIALLGAVLAAISGYLVYDSLSGLETTLFLMLTAAAIAHLLSDTQGRRPVVSGLLLTLVILARPEGMFLLVAAALFEAWRRKASQATFWPYMGLLLLPIILGGLLFAIFSWVSIGTPLPGTGMAKLLYFREHLLPLTTKVLFASGGLREFYEPVFTLLLLSLVGVFALRPPASRLVIIYLVIFYLAYLILLPGGLDHYWRRYQHIVLPFLMLYAAGGTVFLVRMIFRLPVDFRTLLLVVFAFLLISVTVPHYVFMRARFQEDVAYTSSTGVAMANWVQANTPPDTVIATHDIGVLGYYAERQVLDLVGLVNREVLPHHSDRSVRSYLLEEQADYLVILPLHDQFFLYIRPKDDPTAFQWIGEFGPIRGGHTFAVYKIIPAQPVQARW